MRYMLSASVGGKACPLTGRHRRGQCWGQLVRKTVRISELPHAALNRENSEFPASEKNRALVRRPRFVFGDRADRESLVAFQVSLRGQGEAHLARRVPGRRIEEGARPARRYAQAGRRW